MRHRKKVHLLARPADQRKAIVRSLVTKLFVHDQIVTTKGRAMAVKEQVDRIVTLARRGDLHAIRQVARLIYNEKTGGEITLHGKALPETVLRKIFNVVGPQFKNRTSGFVRVVNAPPRRGDAAPMALLQLLDTDLDGVAPAKKKAAPKAAAKVAALAPHVHGPGCNHGHAHAPEETAATPHVHGPGCNHDHGHDEEAPAMPEVAVSDTDAAPLDEDH